MTNLADVLEAIEHALKHLEDVLFEATDQWVCTSDEREIIRNCVEEIRASEEAAKQASRWRDRWDD
jgi:hypothetical protein